MDTMLDTTVSLDRLIDMTVGPDGISFDDFEPEVITIPVDPDVLKVFMGSCHCSLSIIH